MGCASNDRLKNLGIRTISNSNQENTEFAKEVLEDIKGKRNLSDEDKDLQKKFWSICKEYMPEINFSNVKLNIGKNFLKKNVYLLK
jgi:CRISPR/Cas system CMR-associated protein Cmr5 small subunit